MILLTIRPLPLTALAALGMPMVGLAQTQETGTSWLRRLQTDVRDERAIEQLVELGRDAIPVLRAILGAKSEELRALEVRSLDGRRRRSVPIAKIRALEVVRRMDSEALELIPDLIPMLGVNRAWLGNVVDAVFYVDLACFDQRQRAVVEAAMQQNLNVELTRPLVSLRCWRVVSHRGKESLEVAPRDIPTRLQVRGPRRSKFPHTLRLAQSFEKGYFDREVACCLIRHLHAKRKTGDNLKRLLLEELARFYPEDQSSESQMYRDLAHKINPRYLDALARTVQAVAPDEAILAHLHRTRSGSLPKRRAEFFKIAKLGPKAAPAVPWLVSFTTHHDQEFAKEAFMVLGQLGETARPALKALRDIAQGDDVLRAKMAVAAIQNMTATIERASRR